jgi:hypothetical protein
MSLTYTELKAAMQAYLETDEATLVAQLPTIVKQAEDRILKKVQLPDFRKNVTGTVASGDQYLGIPTDFLAPYSLAVDNTGFEFLLFKNVNFVREAYPAGTTTGVPKYYTIFDEEFFLMGPTPDANYLTELHYFYSPESIVTANTSWLGTHAESALLYGCLVEAYTFQKGDADLMGVYEARYKDALNDLKVLAEGRNVTDNYRNG